DADGLPVEIAGTGAFGVNDANDDERIRIPAVAGQTYFLRIKGAALGNLNSPAINIYNVSVINTPAPVPFDLELDDRIIDGAVAAGAPLTASQFQSNLAGLFPDDFFNGKVLSFKFDTTTLGIRGEEAVIADYIGATGRFIFAFPFSAAPVVGDTFQVESVDTGRNNNDNITRDNTPTIFLRVPDVITLAGVATLDDVPFNGTAPGDPPDQFIGIPHISSVLLDVPLASGAGFRVPIFVTENGTSNQTTALVLAGYAQPVDVTNRPGLFSFTFGSAGSFITSLTPDGSYFISARTEMIDPANPQQAQGYGAFAQSLEIFVDTTEPPVSFGDPGIDGDGLTADSDSFVIPNPDTIFDLVTNDLTPTFWGRAEADATIRLFADVFFDLNGNGEFDMGIDVAPNGVFDPNIDVFIGQDTAIPLDGNQQEPNGFWKIESVINFNDPRFFIGLGGTRTVFVTAEDVAGNVNDNVTPQELDIFIDVQGPQIIDVTINAPSGSIDDVYDLFDPKPSTDGPTPLVNSIFIEIVDFPARDLPAFDSPAFKEDVAENPGHYLVTGDYNGIIPILDVEATLDAVVDGQPATGRVELIFRKPGADGIFNTADDIGAPLPDDRFTLFVNDDGIIDLAGNKLDGESNADEPHDSPPPSPDFPDVLGVDGVPTGDGIPGGDFIARFTVDSRPEVAVWAAGSVWVDINGNNQFDPNNTDFTNRDITYMLGLTSDDLFAGKFEPTGAEDAGVALFDKLGAYGRFHGAFRWLIDTNNNGVPDIEVVDPAQVNGLPVAGNFGANLGDEVGLFTGTQWRLDTNHNFQVDTTINWPRPGYPIVGDFDGDGVDDLATWTDDVFAFDLSSVGAPGPVAALNTLTNGVPTGVNGSIEREFKFGFIGPGEQPVTADMNQDGIEDVGLWVPARDGVPPTEGAEWYFLISGVVNNNTPPGVPPQIGPSITGGAYAPGDGPGEYLGFATYGLVAAAYSNGRIVDDPLIAGPGNIVRFEPTPFGKDNYIQYGDQFALPIVGNFDPPVTATGTVGELQEERDPLDVNADGSISPIDALLVINYINAGGVAAPTPGPAGPYLDVNDDNFVSPIDALIIINFLNNQPNGGGGEGEEGEGEAADAFFGDPGLMLDLLGNDPPPSGRRRR
ncbi:MAG TPA: dockerin type I domain-containing protein, partial [Pirellulaceae bacterium]|nr:dockerin type I domain-containing protein [Pirellulaceae bacterium]